MNNFLRFSEYIYGKTVTIVGGGEVLERAEVDASDVVIRINDHWSKKEQTERIDVVFANEERHIPAELPVLTWLILNRDRLLTPEYFEKLDNCLLFSSQPYKRAHQSFSCEWANILSKEYSFRPFTGFLALEFIRTLQPRTIYIDAMDLYTVSEAPPLRRDSHDITSHLQYLRKVVRTDARVRLNNRLYEIVRDTEIPVTCKLCCSHAKHVQSSAGHILSCPNFACPQEEEGFGLSFNEAVLDWNSRNE